MQISPLELLEAVAAHVTTTTGIRAAARRAPISWRDGTSPGRFGVVSHVSPWSATLRGDDLPLVESTLVQVSLFETVAEAADSTDAGTVPTLVAALETPLAGLGIRGRNVEPLLVSEPDSDEIHHAVTVTYQAPR